MAVVPKREYLEGTVKILTSSFKVCERICYVAATKPALTLLDHWGKAGVVFEKLWVVDCVGGKKDDRVKMTTISSPGDLHGISLAVGGFLSEGADCVVFDSVSSLMLYEKPSEVLKFIHGKITRLRNHGAKGIFISLGGDINREVLEQMSMFVDRVVQMSGFKPHTHKEAVVEKETTK